MEVSYVWVKLYEFEQRGDENFSAQHPLLDNYTSLITEFIEECHQRYPYAINFDIRYASKYHGYGAKTDWYELWGHMSKQAAVLYGIDNETKKI